MNEIAKYILIICPCIENTTGLIKCIYFQTKWRKIFYEVINKLKIHLRIKS